MCLSRCSVWALWQVLLVGALVVAVVTGTLAGEQGPETGTNGFHRQVSTALTATPTLVRRVVSNRKSRYDVKGFATRIVNGDVRYTDTNRRPLRKRPAKPKLSQDWLSNTSCDPKSSVVKPLSRLPEFCDFGPKGARDALIDSAALSKGMTMTKITSTKKVSGTYLLDLDSHRLVEKRGENIKQVISFEDILGVRVLEEAEWVTNLNVFMPLEDKHDESMPEQYYRLFVVLFSRLGQPANLRIVANDDAQFQKWVCALQKIIYSRKIIDHKSLLDLHHKVNLARLTLDSAEDQKVGLNTGDKSKLMREHYIALPPLRPSSASSSSSSLATDSTLSSGKDDFYFDRQDIAHLFSQLTKSSILDEQAFMRFACETQQMSQSMASKQFALHRDMVSGMSLAAFVGFMAGPENALGHDTSDLPVAGLDGKLSEYYIATSHNTYLLKDQIIGPSSVDAYILALLTGCRSVEIDIWDGPNDEYIREPIVTHGTPSASSRVTLRYVLRAIVTYAFANNPYPVILSIETGCKAAQQAVAAQIFREELGDLLVTDYLPEFETSVPTLSKLRNKILIKNKHPQAGCKDLKPSPKNSLRRHSFYLLENGMLPNGPRDRQSDEQSESGSLSTTSSNSSNESNKSNGSKAGNVGTPMPRIVPELDELTVYFKGMRLPSLDAKPEFNVMYSLDEKAMTHFEGRRQDFVALTTKTLIRVFPTATRIGSDNYNPVKFWAYGCQMAALNYQTLDLPMQLNNAMFALNGRAGYVVKPPSQGGPKRDTSAMVPSHEYTITVWSGGFIPGNKKMYHEPAMLSVRLYTDQAPYTVEGTASVELSHPTLRDHLPENSLRLPAAKGTPMFVEFVVYCNRKLVANAAVRYDMLRTGYRHIYLDTFDEGAVFVPYLFVHIGRDGTSQPTIGLPAVHSPEPFSFDPTAGHSNDKTGTGSPLYVETHMREPLSVDPTAGHSDDITLVGTPRNVEKHFSASPPSSTSSNRPSYMTVD
ncbi:hypothetical protein H4R34_002961 [Dimargaris verticillata]|uniref:Phosphoinositide phospholipase C n=1 Tax=Dimargaris verticillata TaxID=2761393 RepID=A0A9W8B7T9_9FUNG|nr:hypothetical protein H4R34_002961 [Dimargaris verticillata]